MIYVCDDHGRVCRAKTTSLTLKELCRLAKAYKIKLPKRVDHKEDIYAAVAKAGKLERFMSKAEEIDEESSSESDDESDSGSSSGSSASGSSASGSSASGSSGSSGSSASGSSSDEESSSSSSSAKHQNKKARTTDKTRKAKTSSEDMSRMRAACAAAGLSTSGGADHLRSRLLTALAA